LLLGDQLHLFIGLELAVDGVHAKDRTDRLRDFGTVAGGEDDPRDSAAAQLRQQGCCVGTDRILEYYDSGHLAVDCHCNSGQFRRQPVIEAVRIGTTRPIASKGVAADNHLHPLDQPLQASAGCFPDVLGR
jgi:hypothetical protein